MQIENDYDKEVYNGDIGFVSNVEPEEGKLTAVLMVARSRTALASSMRWCRHTPRASTRAKARNTQPWLFRS